MKRFLRFLLILAIIVPLGACTAIYTAHGVYCHVQPGDTLQSIAQKFHKNVQDLAEINDIEKTADLKPGQLIYIPGVTPRGFTKIIRASEHRGNNHSVAGAGRKKTLTEEAEEQNPSTIEVDHTRFQWPLTSQLSSLFGMRHGRRHDGIDIRSPEGTPIRAARDGEVVFSSRMRGYGNIILIKHDSDFFTVYAHNSHNLVKVGKKVHTGDVIAKVGRTGHATGPHLHFEVREGTKPRNPLFFLPKNSYSEEARKRGEKHGNTESDERESEHES